MTSTPPTDPPSKAPPPAQWLRGVGLLALSGYLVADIADGTLSASIWAYAGGATVVLWGPEILLAAPDVVRAIFRR